MKLKNEYSGYSFWLNKKRIYFIDLDDEKINLWASSGWSWLFEKDEEEEIIIEEEFIEEEKKEVEDNDFN